MAGEWLGLGWSCMWRARAAHAPRELSSPSAFVYEKTGRPCPSTPLSPRAVRSVTLNLDCILAAAAPFSVRRMPVSNGRLLDWSASHPPNQPLLTLSCTSLILVCSKDVPTERALRSTRAVSVPVVLKTLGWHPDAILCQRLCIFGEGTRGTFSSGGTRMAPRGHVCLQEPSHPVTSCKSPPLSR